MAKTVIEEHVFSDLSFMTYDKFVGYRCIQLLMLGIFNYS